MGFDPVSYAMGAKAGGGGGGVTVEPLSVMQNGTYTAQSGKAYSPVTVAVGPASELIATYTLMESWENDTLGVANVVCRTLLGNYPFSENEIYLLIVENNTATNYLGTYMAAQQDTRSVGNYIGLCGRITNVRFDNRNISAGISFWVSVGATIKVYKITV